MDSFYHTVYRINGLKKQFQHLFSHPSVMSKKKKDTSFQESLEEKVAEQKQKIKNQQSLLKKNIVTEQKKIFFDVNKVVSEKENIQHLLRKSAKKYDLPEELLLSVAKVESNFNKMAVSPKGAMGVMQIMPQTAKFLELKNPFSPEENIEAGAKLLKRLLGVYKNDLVKALAAYNAGEGAVNSKKFLKFRETNDYLKKVIDQYIKYSGVK